MWYVLKEFQDDSYVIKEFQDGMSSRNFEAGPVGWYWPHLRRQVDAVYHCHISHDVTLYHLMSHVTQCYITITAGGLSYAKCFEG